MQGDHPTLEGAHNYYATEWLYFMQGSISSFHSLDTQLTGLYRTITVLSKVSSRTSNKVVKGMGQH
jgi:hypothetical protein